MQEFAAISVSTYDPDSLVAQLNERSADGWSVVAIVPTGSTITAYLSHDASATATTDVAAEPTAPPAEQTEPADASEAQGGDGWAASAAAASAAIAPEPATEPALTSSPEPQQAAAPAAATSAAAPAGWYADPSSRYELRYWDGSTWTEHVSRGGQQFTDPPVA